MNPTVNIFTAKPVVIVASEVTEKPHEPTNGCSIKRISLWNVLHVTSLFLISSEISLSLTDQVATSDINLTETE